MSTIFVQHPVTRGATAATSVARIPVIAFPAPRAALPKDRSAEFCAASCLFDGVHGECAGTCRAQALTSAARAKASAGLPQKRIDTRAIYRERNKPRDEASTVPPKIRRVPRPRSFGELAARYYSGGAA